RWESCTASRREARTPAPLRRASSLRIFFCESASSETELRFEQLDDIIDQLSHGWREINRNLPFFWWDQGLNGCDPRNICSASVCAEQTLAYISGRFSPKNGQAPILAPRRAHFARDLM